MSMFYKFNTVTQNLNHATQDVAMGRPITPQAFSTTLTESAALQYDFKPLTGPRKASSHAPAERIQSPGRYLVPNNKTYKRLMEMQTKFSANDGKLVWQKLPKDMPIYYGIIAATTFGFGLTLWTLLKMATPPKNQ